MIKKIINISLISVLALFSSCSYLDVNEKGIVSEKEMFNDLFGFQSALNGVYCSMATDETYGKTLTYGFVEELFHVYTNPSNETLKKTLQHDYTSLEIRPIIDNIWYNQYKTISYVNNIIKHVENGTLNGKISYNYTKAEALGLRAFLHFDILRLFSKSYGNGNELGVPYQTKFNLDVPPTDNIKVTCEKIIADLKEAENLMTDLSNLPASEIKPTENPDWNYYQERAIYFNLYAIKATLARVYLYMNENILAAEKAKEVIDNEKLKLLQKTEIIEKNCFYPNKKEAIFGLYRKDLYKGIYAAVVNNVGVGDATTNIRFVSTNIKELYEQSSFNSTHNDYRLKAYFFTDDKNRTLLTRFGSKPYEENIESEDIINAMTLIQLPEMYYIYSEAIYDSNPRLAIDNINKFINSRGMRNIDLINPAVVDTKQKMVDIIYKERQKEYFGTGMMFLEAKRLNKDIIDADRNAIAASDQLYVLPWPESEKEYGTAK